MESAVKQRRREKAGVFMSALCTARHGFSKGPGACRLQGSRLLGVRRRRPPHSGRHTLMMHHSLVHSRPHLCVRLCTFCRPLAGPPLWSCPSLISGMACAELGEESRRGKGRKQCRGKSGLMAESSGPGSNSGTGAGDSGSS